MKQVLWKDVSVRILKSIAKKWSYIKELCKANENIRQDKKIIGFYWSQCSLCDRMIDRIGVKRCRYCPAYNAFCRNSVGLSPLHPEYWETEPITEAHMRWIDCITNLLGVIKRELNRREMEKNHSDIMAFTCMYRKKRR